MARRRRPRPLVLAVIPLALTSISIQLIAATLMISSGFRGIAEQKATGIVALTSLFAAVTRPLLWRFAEVVACVAIASIMAPWMSGQRGKEQRGSLMHPLTTIAWSAAALVSVICLVWFYRDIVELCMMLADSCRAAEATAALGGLGIADVSAMLSTRIVVLAAGAWMITLCLIAVGFRCLHAEKRTPWTMAGSIAVAVVALTWCGMGISGESRADLYLQAIGQGSSHAQHIYHPYRTMIGDVLHSRAGSERVPDHVRNVQLPASFNSVRFPDADRLDAVILTITSEGQLPENPVDLDTVVDLVRDQLANRADKTVYLRADARVPYGTVVEVFGQLHAAGVDSVGLLTTRRNPQTNSCATSGLEVLIPDPPLPGASKLALQSHQSQLLGVLRGPTIVPMGTLSRDSIMVQVLRGARGVQWKIDGKEVSDLNDFTAQLEILLRQRQERVGFLMADDTLPFSDFVDAVDAGRGAGLDKVAVVIRTQNENGLGQHTVVGFGSSSQQPSNHAYSRSGIDNILDYFREPPPPKNNFLTAPLPPPPPPPPPPRLREP